MKYILIYYSSNVELTTGGVQIATLRLKKYLESVNFSVDLLGFTGGDNLSNVIMLPNSLDECCKMNIEFLKKLLHDRSYDFIINQDGLSLSACNLIFSALFNVKTKVITVFHNEIQWSVVNKIPIKFNILSSVLQFIYVLKNSNKIKNIFKNSDFVVFFTQGNVSKFLRDFDFIDSQKIKIIPNSVSTPVRASTLFNHKLNKVLFVGRIENTQKNVISILRIWKKFSLIKDNWVLEILGEGPDRLSSELFVEKFKIPNVIFRGRQDPSSFYEESKIFIMTSYYEGYPLTLHEAQSYGVVPIVFDSFTSAKFMIDDMFDGVLIKPFDENIFLDKLVNLSNDESLLNKLSNQAIKKSNFFSTNIIGEKWLEILN